MQKGMGNHIDARLPINQWLLLSPAWRKECWEEHGVWDELKLLRVLDLTLRTFGAG